MHLKLLDNFNGTCGLTITLPMPERPMGAASYFPSRRPRTTSASIGYRDQDRCEGHQPWPQHCLPDGRGRHRTANVPGDFAADRGATAAATTSASMRRSMVTRSRATDRRSASKCQGKWPDQTLDQAFGLPEVLVAVSTSRLSCKRAGKTRTLMPVWDPSGESRFRVAITALRQGL